MKIRKMILMLLGLMVIALAGKAFMSMDDMEAALKEAVWLETPVVLPENEGKLVILCGKPETVRPVFDEELGLTLDTVKALRYNEIYEDTDLKDEEYNWKWVRKGTKTLLGEASVGEFALSEDILVSLPADSDYQAFDEQEISRYSLNRPSDGSPVRYVMPKGTYYYWEETQTDRDQDRFTREANRAYAQERGNTPAYAYRVFDAGKVEAMTFVGRQSGNTLTDSGVDGIARMHMGVKSPEELMKSSRTMLTVGSGIGVIVGAALMLLGLMGGKKNSERKERKKG